MNPQRGAIQILIVEDDASIRLVLAEALALEGHSVKTASNGLEAMHEIHASQAHPDVIVLDLQMPVMNGLEFLQRLRGATNSKLASIPVLLITAVLETTPGFLDQARKLANHMIRKPFEHEELLRMIHKLTELKPN